MSEQLFNALNAIETLALGAIKVYGMPLGQGLDRQSGTGPQAVHKPS